MFLSKTLCKSGADCVFALPLKTSFVLIFSADSLKAVYEKKIIKEKHADCLL